MASLNAMIEALKVTRGNILSIKGAMPHGVVTWDVWLQVVEDALGEYGTEAKHG